jgi:hypothetical protein
MKKITILIVIIISFASCATHKNTMKCPTVEVISVSPGENGLCHYRLKGVPSSNLKGTIILIDDNDKYKLGDTFVFSVPNPKTDN